MSYLKINYDRSKGTFERIELPDDPKAWLNTVYVTLDCISVESVSTVISGLVLVVDEFGACWDGFWDRVNTVASMLHNDLSYPIIGDAILCRIDGSELVDLREEDINLILRLAH